MSCLKRFEHRQVKATCNWRNYVVSQRPVLEVQVDIIHMRGVASLPCRYDIVWHRQFHSMCMVTSKAVQFGYGRRSKGHH